MGRVAGEAFAAFDDDDFRWWIGRLADAGDASGVHKTMGYRDRQGVNAWFAARDARNEVGGYASDLDRAWELADAAAGSAEAAGLQCRYALLSALLGDLGSRFTPDLAAVLVRRRVWTREQALAWGRLNSNPTSALDVIANAVDEAEGTRREELVSLAVATSVRDISDNWVRRLAALARVAAPHEQAALLDRIAAETNSGTRLFALHEVIPHLIAGLLPRARAVARAFDNGDMRAEALAAVASRLPPSEQEGAYAEVLKEVRKELAHRSDAGIRLVETLAASLPVAALKSLIDDLSREANLTSYGWARIIAAVSCRTAQTDPAKAIHHAESLPTGPHDDVLAAAARAYANADRITEAVAAAAEINVRHRPGTGPGGDRLESDQR